MTSRHLFTLMFAALLAGACTPPAPQAPDLAAEEKAVRDVSMRWLEFDKARNVDGAAGLMADDAVIYRANREPIMRPAGFKEYITKDYAENPKSTITWSTTSVRVANSGELATETGEYELKAIGPKGDGDDKGRYVTVYVKANGQWKVLNDISVTTKPDTAKAKSGG